ncbi:hypothetical protein NUSPORA_01224 [Nucleospora cyclopteri]
MIIASLIILIFFLYFKMQRFTKTRINNKKILIIGGTKGIGYELTKCLQNNNDVTVLARKQEILLNKTVKFVKCDIMKPETYKNIPTYDYDVIFCCPGVCKPSLYENSDIDDLKNHLDINFIGPISILHHLKRLSTKPFTYVLFSSTLSLFTLPGYSFYSPAKAALLNFQQCLKTESKIDLKILILGTVKTKSYIKENYTKPETTKSIENLSNVALPKEIAEFLIHNLYNRNILYYDWFTYFFGIKFICEKPIDYFLFPFSVIIVFISRIVKKIMCKEIK